MGWADYNYKRNLAKKLFYKLKEVLTKNEIENIAKCSKDLLDLIYKELDEADKKAKKIS